MSAYKDKDIHVEQRIEDERSMSGQSNDSGGLLVQIVLGISLCVG